MNFFSFHVYYPGEQMLRWPITKYGPNLRVPLKADALIYLSSSRFGIIPETKVVALYFN
jgi:hypothetical protein